MSKWVVLYHRQVDVAKFEGPIELVTFDDIQDAERYIDDRERELPGHYKVERV